MNEKKEFTREDKEFVWTQSELILKALYDLGDYVPDGHKGNSPIYQAYAIILKIQKYHGINPES